MEAAVEVFWADVLLLAVSEAVWRLVELELGLELGLERELELEQRTSVESEAPGRQAWVQGLHEEVVPVLVGSPAEGSPMARPCLAEVERLPRMDSLRRVPVCLSEPARRLASRPSSVVPRSSRLVALRSLPRTDATRLDRGSRKCGRIVFDRNCESKSS